MNKLPKCYLAGPITGLTFRGCTDWREHAIKELAKYNIVGVSPMRAKHYLEALDIIDDCYDERKDLHPLAAVTSSSRGITTRDRWDAMNCDLMLVNFLGAEKGSLGTMIEYGWADAARNPIITVIEKEGNVHDHAIMRELTGFRVETLDEGLNVAKAILTY